MQRRSIIAVGIAALAAAALAVTWVRRDGDRVERTPVGADSIVLLGDSLTEQGPWADLLPRRDISNAGYSGFTTAQLLAVATEVADARPLAVFVLTGTNDIRDGLRPEVTGAGLGAIVDVFRQRSPGTRLVVQTVLPRSDAVGAVRATNDEIVAVATELDVEWLDLFAPFDDGRGGLRPAETTDGIHLSRAGYERWARILDGALGERP